MLVQEAMLMAGEAAARYAIARDVPFPFTTQEPPESGEFPEGLAGLYAACPFIVPRNQRAQAQRAIEIHVARAGGRRDGEPVLARAAGR